VKDFFKAEKLVLVFVERKPSPGIPVFVNYHCYELKQRNLSNYLTVTEYFRLSQLCNVTLVPTPAAHIIQVFHPSNHPEKYVGP
jgi:hypothetical protein